MAQSAGGISIPNGVNPNAWTSGDITFLSGTPGAPPSFIDLTDDEISLFDADLRKLSYMIALERDLSALLLSQRDAFLFAASIAKSQLTGRAFGGLLKGSGFNMQMIRPLTILSNVGASDGGRGGTSVLNWKRTFNSTGWQALFGSNANSDPVSLGVTGTSTTAKTTYNRVVIESIGGEREMIYPNMSPSFRSRITSVVIREFEGLDHLPDDPEELLRRNLKNIDGTGTTSRILFII